MALGNQHSVTEWLEEALGSFTVEFPSSSWPFSILDEVQPVALQVRRPLVAVVSGGHRDRVWGGCSFSFSGGCGVAWPRVLAPWHQLLGAPTVPSAFPGSLACQDSLVSLASVAGVWWPGWQMFGGPGACPRASGCHGQCSVLCSR